MYSLFEVSLMYPLCIPHVFHMYPLCIMSTCLHRIAKIEITNLFGNNGKKQQMENSGHYDSGLIAANQSAGHLAV